MNIRGFLLDEICQALAGLGLLGAVSQLSLRQWVARLFFLWKSANIHSHTSGAKSGILSPKIVNVGGLLQDESCQELWLWLALGSRELPLNCF